MDHRNLRQVKRQDVCGVNINTSLERLKKARAIGCSPSYLGIDNYICKKLLSSRINLMARFI